MTKSTLFLCGASQAAMAASLAMAFTADARAQSAPSGEAAVIQLPTLDVQGQEPPNTLRRETGVPRLPGTVQETPQTINVVPRELLEQQNVTTLEQALRNVPGITASAGEGNGGVQGDQFRIRGFTSQNDVYVDGLRDFGSYTRDAFNFDSVTVLKGPSATTFGQNTVGGAININTRTPHLGNSTGGSISGGLGRFFRGTVDVNQQISSTSAVRLNLMGQYNRLTERDKVDSGRWGIAPSIAFGLGTDTTLTVDYMHFEDRRTPDYGVPVVTAPGQAVGKPVTEYGVRRKNWYGIDSDHDDVTVDRVTARVKHVATDWLTLYNDTRFSYVTRDFAASPPTCTGACVTSFFSAVPSRAQVAYSGGVSPFHQETWGIQNVTTAVARFQTGPLRHEATLGLDAWAQNDERTGYTYNITRTNNLVSPSSAVGNYRVIPATGANVRETEQRHLGTFLIDRVWLTSQLSVIGGFRLSNYDISYKTYGNNATASTISSNNTFVDPRASLVWEPTRSQTYYFSYATSTSPAGSFITTQPFSFTSANNSLDPEHNTIYEVGGKVSVLDNRLGLYGALYRIDKGNAFVTDPVSNTVTQSGDEQRNQGIELGVTGQITDNWFLSANYTAMDSETTRSSTAANVGKRVQFVPKNAASVWTTYEAFRETPYQLTLGGGITWRDQVFLDAANTAEVPANFSLDALIAHNFGERKQWRVAANGYNLTNELNYEGLFNNRAVPSAGRTVIFSLSALY
ncbi:TonB-dependent receptor [Roseicella aquatilis]|uniref:TonB-dependent siderophore receptor n=1 Tax=Roseicella aquatilis TaxID=2527868 RepID=A0A4R4DIJ1_9PROT|nr:TonB-dependent siderophore receptor [Roseicella aquatilis]TCZ60842.1 TonB-dependent siderophore receptor [Roseicella aquatilis]